MFSKILQSAFQKPHAAVRYMYGGENMNEDNLYIKLEQIPGGVRLDENYSSRFVECIQVDDMHDSLIILQGLISVIGEINRNSFFKVLYPMFGCSVKTLKNYLYGIAENCSGDHLFERGHGQFYDELIIEGSLPIQTTFSYSVEIDPNNSVHLEMTIYDNLFKHIRTADSSDFADPASLTAAAFAETIYGELYFPALKLLTGDETNEKIKSFVGNLIDELYVPFV